MIVDILKKMYLREEGVK